MGALAPRTVTIVIRGPIAPADLNGICERVCARLSERRVELVLCDVCEAEPDAVTVDALARLELAARRYGCRVRLRSASVDLRKLVSFMGLADVLTDADG
jgi:hypothetical protein